MVYYTHRDKEMRYIKMTNLHNIPDYAFKYEFIVYREVEGEYWFYGAYSNGVKAQAVAHEINGLLLANPWRI